MDNYDQRLDNVANRIEDVILVTDKLAGAPLDRLIDRLSKTADGTTTARRSLEKFSEDVLTVFTKRTVDSIFEAEKSQAAIAGMGFSSPKSTSERLGSGLSLATLPGLTGHTLSPAVNVVVHNNAQATASVQERVNSRGEKEIEIMIDNMVANSLAQGHQTRSVLRSVFGLDNLLKSR